MSKDFLEKLEKMPMIRLARIGYPNCIRTELQTEYAISSASHPKLEWVQRIDVHDPRQVIREPPDIKEKQVIQIRRIVKQESIDKEYKRMYMAQYKVLEIIKEYTYEEWDSYKKGVEDE